MNIAFISDIHGNLQALNSTLKDVQEQGIDILVILGDVATLGPNPKEVIETLDGLEAHFIKGNHDDFLIDLFDNPVDYDSLEIYKWTANQLSGNHIKFLKSFKDVLSLQLNDDTRLIAYHASPWSNAVSVREYIRTVEGKNEFDGYDGDIFIGGHDHIQYKRTVGNKDIVGVGSVGFPYKRVPFSGFPEAYAWSEYAILKVQQGRPEIMFKKVEYDKQAFRQASFRSDNPIKDWLLSITDERKVY